MPILKANTSPQKYQMQSANIGAARYGRHPRQVDTTRLSTGDTSKLLPPQVCTHIGGERSPLRAQSARPTYLLPVGVERDLTTTGF
jgi:hypothetical protein